MLIRFNVKNFLSFSERDDHSSEEFSMISGNVRSKKEHIYDDGSVKLLKFAAVYGANASGKSNFIKALDFMKRTIIDKLPNGYSNKYCKISEKNKSKESYFEVEIKINNNFYAYGFEVILSEGRIVSEWLVQLFSNKDYKVIFNRDVIKGTYEIADFKKANNKLNVYADDIKKDTSVLFLNIMNKNKNLFYDEYTNASVIKDVYDWFFKSLDINYPEKPVSDYSYMIKSDNIDKIGEIISAFGTGISNLKVVDVPPENVLNVIPKRLFDFVKIAAEKKISEINEIIKQNENKNIKATVGFCYRKDKNFFAFEFDEKGEIICKTIKFSHNSKNDILFDLEEESDGTVRLLDLIEILISDDNKTFVIDELDRCLHPSLTYKFIEAYFDKIKNSNTQLIVTTHESRLLDFDLLRRDEIWFTDKNKKGSTDIYSLEEYNERFDRKIDKAYLEGRYGGVPVFDTIFPIEEN